MSHPHPTTRKRRGFTIVELVIVIAVIGILATVLLPTFGDVINNAKDSAAKQEAKNAYTEYMVDAAGSGNVADYCVYEADANRFVAIANGSVVGVYGSKDAALASMVSNPTEALVPTGNDKLFAYGGTPVVPDQPKDDDSYAGKTISILGDSISTFSGVPNVLNYVYPNASVKVQADTWWKQVIDTLGMELLVNNASGGSRVLSDEYFNGTGIRNGNYAAYRDRCVNLHNGSEKPDVILVFMGTNDFSYHVDPDCAKCQDFLRCAECTDRADKNVNVCAACRAASGVYSSFCNQPLGTAADVDLSNAENPTSTCEAYAVMLHKMKQAYPDAEIYCMSLLPRMNPYDANKAKPYHDHGQPTAFNAELKKVAENAGATFVNLEACVDNASATWSIYFGDAVHPTAAGMDMISQAVIDAMLGKDAAHAITWDLTGVTANVTTDLVLNGTAFNATLTANSGYKVSSVKVTMGGKDITASAYADGKLTIPTVTGHVTVTSSAEVDTANGIIWSVMAIDSNTGKDANNGWTKRISTNFINAVNGATVSLVGDNTEFYAYYYDKDFKLVTQSTAYSTNNLNVPAGQYVYMRLMARNKSNPEAALTADYGSNIQVDIPVPGTWKVGAINSSNGTDSFMDTRITTNYIAVSGNITVSVASGTPEFCVFYYDSSMKFLGWNNAYTTTTLTVTPSDCTYIRVMVRNKSNTNATLIADYGSNIKLTF